MQFLLYIALYESKCILVGVALRPPPVADKGSKALSEITSNRKHIYVQRIATIFQTGEHGSPLQYYNRFAEFIKFVFKYNFYY